MEYAGTKLTAEQKLDRLVGVINLAWVERYGGEAVTDIFALETRIKQIGADRDCWLANSRAVQKEYLRLDAIRAKDLLGGRGQGAEECCGSANMAAEGQYYGTIKITGDQVVQHLGRGKEIRFQLRDFRAESASRLAEADMAREIVEIVVAPDGKPSLADEGPDGGLVR